MSIHVTNEVPTDRSRAEYVYEQLRLKLNAGELRPGQRVRESEIGDQLGVSRTPVREALRRLTSSGLLQTVAGRGLIVVEFDQQQVRELYALRGILEAGAAMWAARMASPSEVTMMRDILDRSELVLDSPEGTMRLNMLFHRAIHEAAHNRYLEQALAQLSDSLKLLPGTTFEEPGRSVTCLEEHRALLSAIESRDSQLAELLARKHIEMALAARIRMMFAQSAA